MTFIDFLPYIVSVVTALISLVTSVYICKKNTKVELEKLAMQHQYELEKAKQDHENELEKIQAQSQATLTEQVTEKLVDSLTNSPAYKAKVNTMTNRAFAQKRGRK